MNALTIIVLIIVFNLLATGVFILFVLGSEVLLKTENPFDIFSPVFIYKNYKVNIFGTIVMTLFFNIVMIIPSIIYWFRKLCTVGRK